MFGFSLVGAGPRFPLQFSNPGTTVRVPVVNIRTSDTMNIIMQQMARARHTNAPAFFLEDFFGGVVMQLLYQKSIDMYKEIFLK